MLALALAVLLGPAGAAPADTVPAEAPPPRFSFSLAAGPAGGLDLQRQPVLAERLDEEGEVTSSTALGRELGTTGGFRVAGSVAIALDRDWSIRLGVGSGSASLRSSLDGPDPGLIREAETLAAPASSRVRVSTWDTALRFRIPSERRLRPWVELGVGSERWRSAAGPELPYPGAAELADGVDRMAALAGIGGDVALARGLAARVQATYRALRTPVAPAPAGQPVAESAALRVVFQPHQIGVFTDRAVELAGGVRLEVGLSYSPGPAIRAGAPQSPPGAGASTSALPGSRGPGS